MINKKFRAWVVVLGLSVLLVMTGCTHWYIWTTPKDEPVDAYSGKRTLGSFIEDQNIESKVRANLYKAHPEYRKANFSVVSFNGIVLLTGQLSVPELVKLATKITQDTRRVRQVYNKISVAGSSSMLSRTNDSWLTFTVKSKLLTDKNVPGARIKVVTSSGIVYLMGLLTDIEAKRAVHAIRQVRGVRKIVKVVEYVDARQYAGK